jgi:hypothetical protein
VNGVLVSFFFTAAIRFVPWGAMVDASPRVFSLAVILLWFLIGAVSFWQLAGIWSSAGNYLREGRSRFWGVTAKVGTILGFLATVGNFLNVGVPQIRELAKIAAGMDQPDKYQVRLLRDGTEIEVAGRIGFGLAKEVRRTLDANPEVRIVHLNSPGGRVVEARALRDIIEARRLSTYTSSGCASACTLAYAAGRKRLVASNAQLGFHQYSFPGLRQSAFEGEYDKDRRDWLSRGFDREFIDRAFSTPSSRLWRPTHRELLQWGFITGYADDDEVAVSGLGPEQVSNIEAEISKIPMCAALKTYEPDVYARLVADFRAGLQQGASREEIKAKTTALFKTVYRKRLPHASDSAVRSFASLLLEQSATLSSIDPDLCYDFLYGGGRAAEAEGRFPPALVEREGAVMTEIIRSSSEGAYQPPARDQIEGPMRRVLGDMVRRYGDEVQILTNHGLGRAHKARAAS